MRHVPLRVLGLLGRGRDDVEADVGEEDQRGAGEDPADAEGARARSPGPAAATGSALGTAGGRASRTAG